MDIDAENKKNATFDPWAPQPPSLPQPPEDEFSLGSRKHIAVLEKKLKKVQGRSKELTSKEMLACLSAAKDAHLKHLVNDSVSPYVSTHDYVSEERDDGRVAALHRRLYPERQALNSQELDILTQNDALQQFAMPSDGSDWNLETAASAEAEPSGNTEDQTEDNKT